MESELLARFVVWGALGMLGEVLYTSIYDLVNKREFRLVGTTYLWMFPIYGLIAVLFEPLHDRIADQSWLIRAAVWSLGFTLVELVSGWLLARVTGRCPWDYKRAGARFAINPYIRADYFPLWGGVGLLVEKVRPVAERIADAL